jgi:hypothetical protein
MNREDGRFADQLFDAALALGSNTEPRAGLEDRILAGVAARQKAARRRNWTLSFAVGALAVLAVALAIRVTRRPTVHALPPSPLVAATRPEIPAPPAPIAREPLHPTKVRMPKAAPQRPQQFPTPAPPSEQERLLLLYVKQTPEPVLTAPPANTDKDLEVPELSIAALEIKDLPSLKNEK